MSVEVSNNSDFDHPLLIHRAQLPPDLEDLLKTLKTLAFDIVINRAPIQQLERRGKRIVTKLFAELLSAPTNLIPKASWDASDSTASPARRVCDYVAGMTDAFAENVYRRLFIPGWGSSADEI